LKKNFNNSPESGLLKCLLVYSSLVGGWVSAGEDASAFGGAAARAGGSPEPMNQNAPPPPSMLHTQDEHEHKRITAMRIPLVVLFIYN
jgi:hypothetical protein